VKFGEVYTDELITFLAKLYQGQLTKGAVYDRKFKSTSTRCCHVVNDFTQPYMLHATSEGHVNSSHCCIVCGLRIRQFWKLKFVYGPGLLNNNFTTWPLNLDIWPLAYASSWHVAFHGYFHKLIDIICLLSLVVAHFVHSMECDVYFLTSWLWNDKSICELCVSCDGDLYKLHHNLNF